MSKNKKPGRLGRINREESLNVEDVQMTTYHIQRYTLILKQNMVVLRQKGQ